MLAVLLASDDPRTSWSFIQLLQHIPESPLILLALLLHCLLPVLIIPLQTLLTTSVFHVQTHREPRALTGLLHPE
jgi:hypothetical protein